MANIKLWGTTYNNTEGVELPVEGGGTVVLYERVSGTAGTPTATKGTVSNHAVTVTPSVTNTAGYISGGTKTGTGVIVAASELVSGTLSITRNGTGVDVTNYQKVDVNVSGGGGASNMVTGTFTTSSTKGAAATLSIPYTGSGYPVAGLFWISGGPYNNTSSGNTEWYNSVQRYAIGIWGFAKGRGTVAPTYVGSGDENACSVFAVYKNSTSSATSYSRNSSMTQNTLTLANNNASAQYALAIRFKGNAKTISYFVASTSYGLLASTAYDYLILYSS